MKRFLAILSVATILLGSGTAANAGTTLNAPERVLFRLTNYARTSRGLEPLTKMGKLHELAEAQAYEDMRTGWLGHSLQSPCVYWGENIGATAFGPWRLHRGFMDSSKHRANILNPRFTTIGVGAVRAPDGSLWAVLEFCA